MLRCRHVSTSSLGGRRRAYQAVCLPWPVPSESCLVAQEDHTIHKVTRHSPPRLVGARHADFSQTLVSIGAWGSALAFRAPASASFGAVCMVCFQEARSAIHSHTQGLGGPWPIGKVMAGCERTRHFVGAHVPAHIWHNRQLWAPGVELIGRHSRIRSLSFSAASLLVVGVVRFHRAPG